MTTENLLPNSEPAAARRGRVTCDFCQCQLTPDGEIIKLSTEAKAIRALDDKTAEQAATIARLETELAAATDRAASAERALAERSKSAEYQPLFVK